MRPAAAPLAIIVGTALSYAVALLIGAPWLVPVLNVAPAYPFMVRSLRRGDVPDAIARMSIWAATLGICATTIAYTWPDTAATLFVHGAAYRREMFDFILTGRGAEGDIRQFLPQHLAHAVIFSALALATAGTLAMALGAALMNYMATYVGSLAAVSAHPVRMLALAWVPWSLVRIASFVVIGVVLSGPLLGRLFRFEYRLGDERRWLILAAAGLIADVLLKWALAPWWRTLLRF
jgi:hypothetical protein